MGQKDHKWKKKQKGQGIDEIFLTWGQKKCKILSLYTIYNLPVVLQIVKANII